MRLDPRAIAAVIDVCTLRYTTEGEVLVEQGQPGNYFFVVKEGTFALKVTVLP
jgi:CRP-like cAMP-binding protein